MKPLILIGGGGHCKSVIDVVELEGSYSIIGILDAASRVGESVLNYEIIGTDSDIARLAKSGHVFVNTVGQIESPEARIHVFQKLLLHSATVPSIISPAARVSNHARVGMGTVVMHKAVINAAARVGENCIINTAAIIEHDVHVGDHCHVSTGAVLNGGSRVGEQGFIGSNSVVLQGLALSEKSVIGAGTIITSDILEPGGVWVGCPGRRIR